VHTVRGPPSLGAELLLLSYFKDKIEGPGVVVHCYNPSCSRGGGRWIVAGRCLARQKLAGDGFWRKEKKKKKKAKGLRT
jgi:hypothetical protein